MNCNAHPVQGVPFCPCYTRWAVRSRGIQPRQLLGRGAAFLQKAVRYRCEVEELHAQDGNKTLTSLLSLRSCGRLLRTPLRTRGAPTTRRAARALTAPSPRPVPPLRRAGRGTRDGPTLIDRWSWRHRGDSTPIMNACAGTVPRLPPLEGLTPPLWVPRIRAETRARDLRRPRRATSDAPH